MQKILGKETIPSDTELLERFVENAAEDAFALILARYEEMVFKTALRITQQSEDAEDVAQAVFVILARKAGSR